MKEGEALIRTRAMANAPGAGVQVKFQSDYVLNPVDTWEKIDIRPKTYLYQVEGRLSEGSSCSLEVEYTISIPSREDSVLCAARVVGAARASSQETVWELLRFPLVEAVQVALSTCTSERLTGEKELICDGLIDLTTFCLTAYGFEVQSVDFRKVRIHKKAAEKWIP